MLYLEQFTDEQIRSVIIGRKGAKEGPTIADRILSNQNLAEMARKPVLIELLLAALKEVSADVLENQAEVYLYATNALLLRNITAEKTFTSTADKLYFLCELAWEMIKSGELRIHYTVIPERIKDYFGDKIKDQHELDTWDFDLRNQTLLHRDAAGYYEFAHKSLAEFFVAFKFATELDCLKSKFSKTYTEADGNACRIPFESKNISELAKTFGLLKLTDERMIAVRKLLQKIVDDYNSEKLWENIFQTCGIDSGHVRFVGGNLATLLRDQGELFTYTDMSKTNLSGADLCGVNLSYTDLTSSHLHEININHLTNFNETDLTNASISVGNFDDSAYTINTINQDGTLIGVGMEDKIKVYNLISKELIFESKQICHSGIFPAFSPNGDKLAGGSKEWIKVWDLSTGREELTIKLNPIDNVIIIPVFSPKGDHIAARAKEWLKIWNSSNGEEIIAIDLPVDLNWELISNFMIYPSFSPDGKNIVIGDGDGVSIWDSIKGTKLQTIQIKRDADEVVCPVFSPNGEHIAIHSKNSLTILETSTNKELLVIDFPKGQAFSICPAFHPNNNKIIGASHKYLRTWDIKDGGVDLDIPCDSLYLMNMISVDRYGRLVTGIFDNHSSRVWSLDTGEEVYVSEEQLNCKNMNITGTHGLEQQITWMTRNGGRSSSLLEFFADRGAILDEEQQRIRAELHHKREERQRIRAELLRKRAAEQRLKRAEDEQRQAAEETAAAEPAKKPRARRKKGAE